MDFFCLFLFCALGSYLGHKLKLPAGQLLGSLFATAAVTITLTPIPYPPEIKFIARVFSGILIGLKIRKEDLAMLKTIWKPVLFLTLGMIFNATFIALFLAKYTSMDLTTALFACVPGGMADISLMADDYGANMSQVALIQLLRLISLILLYPFLANKIAENNPTDSNINQTHQTPEKKKTKKSPTQSQHLKSPTPLFVPSPDRPLQELNLPDLKTTKTKSTPQKKSPNKTTKDSKIIPFPQEKVTNTHPSNHEKTSKNKTFLNLPPISEQQIAQAVRTFVYGGLGAYLFDYFNIPAGELLGSMTVTLYRKLKTEQGYFYPPVRSYIQVTVGILIGSTITPDTLQDLSTMFPITILAATFIVLFSILLGKLLPKIYPTDKVTALLAVAPGGVQEMILLADSLGGNIPFVTSLQVFRLLIVFSFFPFWISFLLSILQ